MSAMSGSIIRSGRIRRHELRGFKSMPNSGSSEVAEGPRSETRSFEIPNAIRGFELLKGKLPFSVVPGNHDYDAPVTDPAHPPQPGRSDSLKIGLRHLGGLDGFPLGILGPVRILQGPALVCRFARWRCGQRADFHGRRLSLPHIGLQFDAPDASLAWATRVIHRFPGVPTIVTTHKYLDRDGSRADTPALDPEHPRCARQ
jgi:hypothetical protein